MAVQIFKQTYPYGFYKEREDCFVHNKRYILAVVIKQKKYTHWLPVTHMFTTIDPKVIESESNGVPHHATIASTELISR